MTLEEKVQALISDLTDPTLAAELVVAVVRAAVRSEVSAELEEEAKRARERDAARDRKRAQRERDMSVTERDRGVTSTVTFRDPTVTVTKSPPLHSPSDPSPLNLIPELEADPDLTPAHVSRYSADFLEFWALYPKKVGKEAAWRKWRAAKPALADVKAALAWQMPSQHWKDGFVKDPARYLHERGWLDERDTGVTKRDQSVTNGRSLPMLYDPNYIEPK